MPVDGDGFKSAAADGRAAAQAQTHQPRHRQDAAENVQRVRGGQYVKERVTLLAIRASVFQ